MKKLACFLIGALLFACCPKAEAQTVATDYAGRISGPITHTNAQADTTSVTISGSKSVVIFKYDIAKTSGTVAGTIVLQGKLTSVSGEQWATLNSYTITDGTQTVEVTYTYNPGVIYRIIDATTGTSVSVHNKFLLYRK